MKIKLSDAIKLGSMLRPQGFGRTFTLSGKSCAVGAALESVGVLYNPEVRTAAVYSYWPWIDIQSAMCPCDSNVHDSVEGIIVRLNDVHLWSREEIASWVATVEPSDSPEVPETQEVLEEVEK